MGYLAALRHWSVAHANVIRDGVRSLHAPETIRPKLHHFIVSGPREFESIVGPTNSKRPAVDHIPAARRL